MPVFNRRMPFRTRRSLALLAPIDLLVTLLMGPVRRRDEVAEDLAAARRRWRD